MSDNEIYIWQELIKNFLQDKLNSDLISYIKNIFKEVKIFYNNKVLSDDRLADLINARKPNNISDIDFQKGRFSELLIIAEHFDCLDKENMQESYLKEKNKIEEKYYADSWLENAANNVSSVTFATHVAKLTHSKISTSSIFDSIEIKRKDMLTTSALSEIIVDGAVKGNQYAPIYQFLALENQGVTLAKVLAGEEGKSILGLFTKDEEKASKLQQQFRTVTQAPEPSTHALAKQIYFPTDNEGSYHLLTNMISSSLAHKIYSNIFNNEEKNIRGNYFDKKYNDNPFLDYSQKASLSVTASNNSNASQLNGKRGGKLYLFNAQPPVWQTQLKPPVHYGSMFSIPALNYACTDDISSLRKMLINSLDVYKRPEVMKGLENWCKSVANEVLTYVSQIQHIESGWSKGSRLSKQAISHCYLLDLYRDDEVFLAGRKNSNWQETVSEHFAHWLNQKLAGKDKQFTPQPEHRKIWQRIFADKLRDYMDTVLIEESK